ncbi:hypothetical protein CPB84DRAFT_1791246 [Gymnopilus junonius]|uniref:Aminoglycoside phosphotransferase domain-containing protein n=1 Tax=Gymnopilus junonius TaxID=109634 RepID=A0A9P5NFM9_GYMJU|nr:hypothetical protein CPB84DRAFT_1791246 [Gymnopilus junonius]
MGFTRAIRQDSSTLPQYLNSPIRELKGSNYWKYKFILKYGRFIHRASLVFHRGSCFIKAGRRVHFAEALTMDYLARNTTIPIPNLLDIFCINGEVHIVQQYIKAPLPSDEKRSSMVQLKDCLDQLRALTPPHPDRVQAINGSGFIDDRLGMGELGPFDDHEAFHRFLGYHVLRDCPERFPLVQEAISKTRGRNTEGLLSWRSCPHNILWKDGQIFLIDWERSGWFPEYWDYNRAYAGRGFCMPDWWELFTEIVDRYDDELDVDIQMANYVERIL